MLYVGLYWTSLYDVGQIIPFGYTSNDNPAPSIGASNNIFVNASLFASYSSSFKDTSQLVLKYPLPAFRPIDHTNVLQPANTTLLRSYSCVERQPKSAISMAVALIAGEYSLIMIGFHTVSFLVTGWAWTRRIRKGISFSTTLRLDKLNNPDDLGNEEQRDGVNENLLETILG